MQTRTRKCISVASLVTAQVAAILAVAAWLAPVSESTIAPQAANAASVPMIGVPTGEIVDGVAVYRFPTIVVSANRSVERARIEQEDALAHARSSAALAARQGPPME